MGTTTVPAQLPPSDPALPPDSPVPPVESGSTSPPIPPTPTPPARVTDPAYVELLEGTLSAQNRRIQTLEDQIVRGSATATPAPPAKTTEELRQEFYDNPIEASRKVMREELAATIAPIQEFVSQFKGQSVIDDFVGRYKLNPRFAAHWTPAVERYVREQAATVPAKQLNENSFGFIVVSAVGMSQTGMLGETPSPAPAPAPSPAPVRSSSENAPMPAPPYIPPSAPPGPSNYPQNTPQHRALTEDEKRILREYNSKKSPEKRMTEAQFIEWQNMPADVVARTDFDKPRPAGR